MPEFRYAKEFLMLKMCYCSIMLNTGHAHPFTIILGVKNQSEAMAASRYPFSGEHAECKKTVLVHVMLLLFQGFCAGSWHE